MKNFSYGLLVLAFIYVGSGCAQNQTRIGEGAGMGGLLGAAAGGIIGHQSGHGWQGALIGGAAGAAGGAMIGSQINKPQTEVVTTEPAPGQPVTTTTTTSQTTARPLPLTMQQIVDMTKQGSTSDQIIAQIQSTHASYVLNADDVNFLHANGVSERVIEYMQSAK